MADSLQQGPSSEPAMPVGSQTSTSPVSPQSSPPVPFSDRPQMGTEPRSLEQEQRSLSHSSPGSPVKAPTSNPEALGPKRAAKVQSTHKATPNRQPAHVFHRISAPVKSLVRWSGRQMWWPWETLCWALSFAFLVAIVVMLIVFDGKTLPDWQFGITPNALVSVFATISTFLLAVPIASALGQLKWTWFQQAHLLTDFGAIDEASKGPIGSLLLLLQGRGGLLTALGAFLTILTLAIGPFVQQIITFENRHVRVGDATLNTTPNYTLLIGDPDQVDLQIAAAALSGALHPQAINSSVVPVCSTGNYTWPTYHSLAVCSECANLSASLQTTRDYQYVLPNGAMLNPYDPSPYDNEYDTNGLVLNVTTTYNSLKTIAFPNRGRIIADVFAISSTGPYLDFPSAPIAFECILHFCVKTYNTSVNSGTFDEREIRLLGDSGPTTMVGSDQLTSDYNYDHGGELNITVAEKTFSIDQDAQYSVSNFFNSTFTGIVMSARDAVYYYSSDVMNSIYQALTGTQNPVYATEHLDHAYTADLNPLFKNMERSMTTMLRNGYLNKRISGTGLAVGDATQNEAFLHVRWPWIILPGLVQLLALVFMVLVILKTRRAEVEQYKGSLLSVLFHGIDEESRQLMRPLNHQFDLEDEARDMEVEFVNRNGIGWRLLPKHCKHNEQDHDGYSDRHERSPP